MYDALKSVAFLGPAKISIDTLLLGMNKKPDTTLVASGLYLTKQQNNCVAVDSYFGTVVG